MGVATRRTTLKRIHQKTSSLFALIKRRLRLKVRLPQAPTCCTAVAVVVRFGERGLAAPARNEALRCKPGEVLG